MRITSKVFWDLALLMGGFGLAMGLVFPPFVVLLGMPADRAFSGQFFASTVAAGLIVGGVNYALSRTIVGGRLRQLAGGMRAVEACLDGGEEALMEHRLHVDSSDELGDCARSFNNLVGALDRSRAEERRLSRTDDLTGLANRRHGLEVLNRELAAAGRKRVGLLLLDVDEFKWVNDLHGHLAGDDALRSVADDVRRAVREGDVVCRYGGDEILVVLPGCPAQTLKDVGERLRLRVEAHRLVIGGKELKLTVSVGGAAASEEGGDTATDLIARADMALYSSKTEGRNRLTLVA